MSLQQHSIRNSLLSRIPRTEFDFVGERLEPVPMDKGFHIAHSGRPVEAVYFPETGIGSIIAVSPEGNRAEAGIFGREGFSPSGAAVGANISMHDIVIQGRGEAHRLSLADFHDCLEQCPMFRNLLGCYLHSLSTQISYTALSNAVHQVDERLARWLLMCHDRSDGDEMALTHEFLALMLAVRRPSVTTALHVLEGNGFIRAERGYVSIRNRDALKDFATDAYGKPEEEYQRLIGPIQ